MLRRSTAVTCLIAALALTGCAQQPHDVILPDLVWDNGIEPSSPLEEAPDVVFAREISLAYAYATNAGDFAFTFLVDNYPRHSIEQAYTGYYHQTDPDSTIRYPGPFPMQPLTVEPFTFDIAEDDDPDTYSLLTFCGAGDSLWVQRESDPDITGIFDPTLARTGFMIIGTRPDDTRYLFDVNYSGGEARLGAGEPCDGTQIPVGRFDPPFPFADAPVTEAPYPPLNYTRPARNRRRRTCFPVTA